MNNSRRSEQMDVPEAQFCEEAGCIRKVLPPNIYCDKHVDESSAPQPQPNDVDLFSEDALQLAEALHKQYPNTWDVLYHKGLMPELIAFIKADRQKAEQRANRTLRLAALKHKGEMAKAVTAARIDENEREWTFGLPVDESEDFKRGFRAATSQIGIGRERRINQLTDQEEIE